MYNLNIEAAQTAFSLCMSCVYIWIQLISNHLNLKMIHVSQVGSSGIFSKSFTKFFQNEIEKFFDNKNSTYLSLVITVHAIRSLLSENKNIYLK